MRPLNNRPRNALPERNHGAYHLSPQTATTSASTATTDATAPAHLVSPPVTPVQPTQSAVDTQGEALTWVGLLSSHQIPSKHAQKQVSDTVPTGQASCERGQPLAPAQLYPQPVRTRTHYWADSRPRLPSSRCLRS